MSGTIAHQQTLAGTATLKGTSLHTGEKVSLTLRPADPNEGFRFRRVDLKDQPFIRVEAHRVESAERATTISEGGIKIHTVEHVISALAGMGIDNAVIEMDSNEPPIGDGSARPFVELIRKAGIVDQPELRRVFEVREPLHLETKEGSLITVVPDKRFRISCTQMGPGGRFTQFSSFEITPEVYEKELAPARTFVYYDDIRDLLEGGKIKGGSLENAIVIRDEEVLSKEALRFSDEFVRHKIMDLVGDLMLSGRRIMGHVIAVRPGHRANTEMAQRIHSAYRNIEAATPKPLIIPTGKGVLDISEVMKILPHRYPFLMVDRVVDFEGDQKCTGIKQITINEPYFQGHFPGHPVMPGVLQIEAMAQVASIIMLRTSENQGKIGYFASADNVKFRRPVIPGDTLVIEAEFVKARRNIGQANCRCLVQGELASSAELKFALLDR
jgi:UDP-3-O-[3-hydroxymyristoyl] N-acetylglucosamine deacetylase / 3-hydroxyacyl-[acyl-carrier-protein] dehydratase